MDGMPLCEATKHIVQVVVATCNYEIIIPYLQDLIFTHFANENKTQTFRFWCIKDTANQSQSKMQISGPPFCMIYPRTHAHTQRERDIHKRTHTHRDRETHTYTHTHTHTDTRTHTHTHTRTHKPSSPLICLRVAASPWISPTAHTPSHRTLSSLTRDQTLSSGMTPPSTWLSSPSHLRLELTMQQHGNGTSMQT